MRYMPVILYNEDRFTNPPFRPDIVVDIGSVVELKLKMASLNVSQVYEWLPYTYGEEVMEDIMNFLIEKYGEEKGSRVRFAEAYEICEYGKPMTDEMKKELFGF